MDKVVHFEIPADDVERAQKFYKSVFGWGINRAPGMDYTLITTTPIDKKSMLPKEPGAINGGMMTRQGEVKSPVITINVRDADAALREIEKAGGKTVMKKMKVGEIGYAAYFKDTEGNILGLWQNAKQG